MQINVVTSELPEVIQIDLKVFTDDRGFFLESYQEEKFYNAGIPFAFVQDNHSGSKKGVLRGLHYQIKQPQGKLLRVLVGEIFDVAVDLRRSSATFGRWVGKVLKSDDKQMIWVPPGFAHGFLVLSEWAEVLYKATDYYAPQYERTLLWNDPQLGINWPLNGLDPLLSTKDMMGKTIKEADLFD